MLLQLKSISSFLICGLLACCFLFNIAQAETQLANKNQTQLTSTYSEPYLYGKVILAHGAPLSDATILILDKQGRNISEHFMAPADPDFCRPRGKRCTSASGSFAFRLTAPLPPEFQIIAKGGQFNGKKNNAILRQWVSEDKDLRFGASLTIGSTIAAELLTKGLDQESAVAKTRVALGLQKWTNLSNHLYFSPVYLSGQNLLAAASRHGGLKHAMHHLIASARWGRRDAWIDDARNESPQNLVRAAPAAPAPSFELPELPDWATGILKGVPVGIVNSLIGQGLNWLVGAIGLNPTLNGLADIQNELSVMSTQLTQIQGAINDLRADVDSNFANLKLLETCNQEQQAATTEWGNVQPLADEVLAFTEWMQQMADYGTGKESLATATTAWNHINSAGDDLSSGKGLNSLINTLTGLNAPPGQKGFVSNIVAAYSSCTLQQGKTFLNSGDRASYSAMFNWGMALMITSSMVQSNYDYSGTWKCVVAPQGTSGGTASLLCPAGTLAFPSSVAKGTTPPSPTPRDIYYAFNNAYPQMLPSGVSVDLRSGLLWTRYAVKPNTMVDGSGLVTTLSDLRNNQTFKEVPINSMTQWRLPSQKVAQSLIADVPSGTLPADWLNHQTQAISGVTAFDSVSGNLASKQLYTDGVLGTPPSSKIQPSNTKDLSAPWGSLIGLFPVIPGANNNSWQATYIVPNNTRAYGIMTLESIKTPICIASQSMFGDPSETPSPNVAYCAASPQPGTPFLPASVQLNQAVVKDAYSLVMLDQSSLAFNPDWRSGFPLTQAGSLLNCSFTSCVFGGFHTLVLRDTALYIEAADLLIQGYGIPKDYAGYYLTGLVHEQSQDKLLTITSTNSGGLPITRTHAPSFTTIPGNWGQNITP